MKDNTTLIDVHHHYNPLFNTKLPEPLNSRLKNEMQWNWNIREDLEFISENKISYAILSYPVINSMLSASENIHLASMINESFATLMAKHRCLGAFAYLPYQDMQSALEEVEYALDTLHLDGVFLPTSIAGLELYDRYFDDFYRELNKRKALVFIHPTMEMKQADDKYENLLMGQMNEVTRAACELVYGGVLHRYPDIRFILSYGGGNVSFFSSRIIKGVVYPNLAQHSEKMNYPKGIEYYLKQFYYDTALPVHTNILNCLKMFVSRSQILYGSDYPFSPVSNILQNISHVKLTKSVDGNNLADCCENNTVQLLRAD